MALKPHWRIAMAFAELYRLRGRGAPAGGWQRAIVAAGGSADWADWCSSREDCGPWKSFGWEEERNSLCRRCTK